VSNNALHAWLVRPRDPLVFRDGKPFTAVPGARAQSVPFPFPSTVAGAVRTRSGALVGGGVFPKNHQTVIEQVKAYQVVGPFLYSLSGKTLLLPAPNDALLTLVDPSNGEEAHQIVLRPTGRFNEKVMTNLPQDLRLVGPVQPSKAKTHPKAPRFWYWEQFEKWLVAPRPDEKVRLADLGIVQLPMDVRTHVSIQAGTSTAEEGALFQTGGLAFAHAPVHDKFPALVKAEEFALLVQTDADPFKEGVDTLGGERRMVAWEKTTVSLPICPREVREAILTTRQGRLVLATPAAFEKGFLPTWVCSHPSGVKLRIVGVAVGRPVHVSGWDYEKGAPKPTRRLAPAGSVYFFEIAEGDEAAVDRFIDEVWFAPVSDVEQDRRDGFGIALLGTWNEKED